MKLRLSMSRRSIFICGVMASKTEGEIFVDLPVILEWKRTTDSDGVWRPHCVEGRVGSELDMHETRAEREGVRTVLPGLRSRRYTKRVNFGFGLVGTGNLLCCCCFFFFNFFFFFCFQCQWLSAIPRWGRQLPVSVPVCHR